ncbi:FAD-dependent oxidoreductase [Streptomyces sp. RPT161]|uniref:FAD-dependent oxidoreductase n=1 Tax=Streptomyces sp. RPT161 TaxID=3015993 RepID=UPI0022B9024C|nr:FAD-dependent oxidoreductase [Streptomyces sp. RPT161]
MAERRQAVVIGAGIGGLSAALALRQQGWDVAVFERAPALEPVGSGLAVAPNAMRALDVLGLGDEVRAAAVRQGEGGLRRASGRWLVRTDLARFEEAFGDPVAVLPRPVLVGLLADRLPAGTLRTSAPASVTDAGSEERPARVRIAANECQADLVVAADGIHSATRAALFPSHPGPRYSGFTAWRTVVAAPPCPVPLGETWGRGALTGLVPLPGRRLYLYAAAVAPAGQTARDGDERAELMRRFGEWCAPLPELLTAVSPGQVLRNDVYEMVERLPAYHGGRVALLGDAAHAMTPFQGQGACQAIEDAVVLARSSDLARYSAVRLPRATDVVNRSRRVGRAVAVQARSAVLLRDLGLALAGRLPLIRMAAPLYDWNPPGVQAEPAPLDQGGGQSRCRP